jgi:PAS domain S-box-containing protein
MLDPSDLVLHIPVAAGSSLRAIEGVTIGIALADCRRTLLQANAAFCDYLGYALPELLGMNIDELTHPDDRERTAQVFQTLQAHEDPVHAYEKRYLHKSGAVLWSLTTVNRLAADAPGDPPLFVGFIQDITPQKDIERKLRSTKGLYQALVENLGVGLSLIDRDHRIQMVNSTLAQIFERTPEDFVGRSCFREFERRQAICPHCPGVPAMESGQPQTVVTEGVLADGRHFKVRIKAFPVFDAEGGCSGFVELIEDLTTQLQTEMALQASEGRFKALAEAAPIGIFEVDAAGQNTYSNPAWVRMTGLSVEESLGYGWVAAIPAEDRRRVVAGRRPSTERNPGRGSTVCCTAMASCAGFRRPPFRCGTTTANCSAMSAPSSISPSRNRPCSSLPRASSGSAAFSKNPAWACA